jgi:hypothetical protein
MLLLRYSRLQVPGAELPVAESSTVSVLSLSSDVSGVSNGSIVIAVSSFGMHVSPIIQVTQVFNA